MHGFQGLMLQYFLYFTSFTLLAGAKVVQTERNTKYLFEFFLNAAYFQPIKQTKGSANRAKSPYQTQT